MTCHRQVITAYGLTGRIMLLGLLSTSLLWLVAAPSRERSGGGLGVIGLITGKNTTRLRVRHNLLNPVQLHRYRSGPL